MPRFRPKELQHYLQELGVVPKKGLSQNFLIDGNILNKIIELSGVQEGDRVLEIGPGPGALTEKLLEAGCRVVAIEKDPIFAQALAQANDSNSLDLQVICSDVLDVSFEQFGPNLKVVANLPYHLTTPILYKILKASHCIESATLMVQEEVAKRLVAPLTSKDVGAVNIILNYYTKPKYGFSVSPKSFYPVPKVHSAVIHLQRQKAFQLSDEAKFIELVQKAFSMRRKRLTSSLRDLYPQEEIQKSLVELGKAATARPEELSLSEWVSLHEGLTRRCGR